MPSVFQASFPAGVSCARVSGVREAQQTRSPSGLWHGSGAYQDPAPRVDLAMCRCQQGPIRKGERGPRLSLVVFLNRRYTRCSWKSAEARNTQNVASARLPAPPSPRLNNGPMLPRRSSPEIRRSLTARTFGGAQAAVACVFEQRCEEESSEKTVHSEVPATPPKVIHSLG